VDLSGVVRHEDIVAAAEQSSRSSTLALTEVVLKWILDVG
jgi:hypothetical protein